MFKDFVKELKEKNITIRYVNGKLKYSGPEGNIDEKMLLRLKEYKSKLLKHFWPEECWNMMPIQTDGDLTPMVLLHGGPANYPISEYLGQDRPYYGYFYIGSEGEKIRYKNLECFAAEYLKQLQFILPNGPYYLGGMSFGGHMSYEMAIRLQDQGQEVPLLFLIDAGLPDEINDIKRLSITKQVYEIGKKIYYYFYDLMWTVVFGFMTSYKDKIPVAKRNRYIRWTYKEYIKKYHPSKRFNGKIIVFRADENQSVQKYLGWDKFCDDIELIEFKGNHGSMFHDKDSVDVLSEHIARYIDEYEKKSSMKSKPNKEDEVFSNIA